MQSQLSEGRKLSSMGMTLQLDLLANYPLGQKVVRTKGDANPDSIPGADYLIFEKNYIGKVVCVIPKLGIITSVFHPQIRLVYLYCEILH
jgi:hypothetical protein